VFVETFEVYLMPSANLKSSGDCLLQVTADSVQLLDIDNPRRVQLSWPLRAIRRYNVERGMFSLEAGRSLFTVVTHVGTLASQPVTMAVFRAVFDGVGVQGGLTPRKR